MSTLTYVGRNPDSDSTIVPKTYADSQQGLLGLSGGGVTSILNTAVATLTSKAYVDTQDASKAQKSGVNTADALYVNATKLGANSGVASLDSSGNVPSAQLPTSGAVTDRVATCYSLNQSTGTSGLPLLGGTLGTVLGAVGTVLLGSGSSHTVSSTNPREFKLGTISVPDPGYPYRALPFAWVQGNSSSGTNPGTRLGGNGNYGLLTCCPPSGVSDQVYGIGVCTGSLSTDTYLLTPYAAQNQTHISVGAVNGALTLDLYCSMWSGTTYTFYGTNLNYFVLVVPSL